MKLQQVELPEHLQLCRTNIAIAIEQPNTKLTSNATNSHILAILDILIIVSSHDNSSCMLRSLCGVPLLPCIDYAIDLYVIATQHTHKILSKFKPH